MIITCADARDYYDANKTILNSVYPLVMAHVQKAIDNGDDVAYWSTVDMSNHLVGLLKMQLTKNGFTITEWVDDKDGISISGWVS